MDIKEAQIKSFIQLEKKKTAHIKHMKMYFQIHFKLLNNKV